MLTRPDISDDDIVTCLRDSYGLVASQVTFLPINADLNCAVFRVVARDGTAYFLKLRPWSSSPVTAAIPAFLHGQGIQRVMAPVTTVTHELWVREHGFNWLLYPFFEGKTGLQVELSRPQWIALGQCLQAVHATVLPAALAERVPREEFAPRWRILLRAIQQQMGQSAFDDPVTAKLAAFWATQRDEIQLILDRAEQLARLLDHRALNLVLCHSDLHGDNVLVGADDTLAVVDWDEPILAPKERDLMFVGGGVGGAWNQDQQAAWFFEGYGHTAVDPVALAYYRYERIVVDLVEYSQEILGGQGTVGDRIEGLQRLMSVFLPGNVIQMAHKVYPYPVGSRSTVPIRLSA